MTIGKRMPQTRLVDLTQEEQSIAKVIDHLLERFPTLGRDRVETVVEESRSLLDGNPIRDYVPVLVERTAKDRLRRMVAGGPTAPATV